MKIIQITTIGWANGDAGLHGLGDDGNLYIWGTKPVPVEKEDALVYEDRTGWHLLVDEMADQN